MDFLKKSSTSVDESNDFWNILIVDDDLSVHEITRLALRNLKYKNKRINFTSAYCATEAKDLLKNNSDYTVILLDVVMENNHAGLDVAKFIREDLNNKTSRIIIRTGQSGENPEQDIIDNYDINDYKEKTDLNAQKLITTVQLAIAQYEELTSFITQRDKLYHDVTRNSTTGLYNRFKLDEILCLRRKASSIIIFNIDSFSHYNDMYGFEYGDSVLIQCSKIFKQITPSHQKLFHIGIDEFAILLDKTNIEEANEIIDTVYSTFENHTFDFDDIEVLISFTSSIVLNEDKNLIIKANLALKEARSISKNRVQVYHDNMQVIEQIENNSKWAKTLKKAINEDRLVPYFQPILNNETMLIEKYECLVRIEEGDIVISPFEFLSVAKNLGLSGTITKTMLRKSAEIFKDNEYYFSINLSSHDLGDLSLIKYIKHILDKYSIEAHRLIFEILEDNSLANSSTSRDFIDQLREMGCQISLDDFGAQCQNFSNLINIEFESIKIDGCFIQEIKELKPRKMIESMVYFSKNIGFPLIAEYVSSKDIFDLVCSLGIKYSQGYLIGKPKPYLLDENVISL